MHKTFNEIRKWYIIPLCGVEIITATDNIVFGSKSDALLTTILADSKWSFDSITRQNDTGGDDIVGFKLLCDINIIQNDFNNMLESFAIITAIQITQINLYLRANSGQVNGHVMEIKPHIADANYASDFSVVFNIDSSNESPILKIAIKAILSADVITQSAPTLFNLIS